MDVYGFCMWSLLVIDNLYLFRPRLFVRVRMIKLWGYSYSSLLTLTRTITLTNRNLYWVRGTARRGTIRHQAKFHDNRLHCHQHICRRRKKITANLCLISDKTLHLQIINLYKWTYQRVILVLNLYQQQHEFVVASTFLFSLVKC